jgi:hypothetical protein
LSRKPSATVGKVEKLVEVAANVVPLRGGEPGDHRLASFRSFASKPSENQL